MRPVQQVGPYETLAPLLLHPGAHFGECAFGGPRFPHPNPVVGTSDLRRLPSLNTRDFRTKDGSGSIRENVVLPRGYSHRSLTPNT